jgi:hypothetical protein
MSLKWNNPLKRFILTDARARTHTNTHTHTHTKLWKSWEKVGSKNVKEYRWRFTLTAQGSHESSSLNSKIEGMHWHWDIKLIDSDGQFFLSLEHTHTH